MSYSFVLVVVIIGLSGIIAQVLLLRELLVSFYGNELIIGIILANWLAAEALGAFLLGRHADRARDKTSLLVICQLLFSLFLPLAIFLSRTFKGLSGVPAGEGLGLYTIFWSSLLIVFPASFCHGALFTLSCRLLDSIGKAYAWETIGTILGAAVLTYVFIPLLNSFQIAFFISVAGLVICYFLSRNYALLRYISASLFILAAYFLLTGIPQKLQHLSAEMQWKPQQVLDYRDSVYGNIVVAQREKQHTFFYNGIPLVTVPYPDMTFVEEFGNLPLLFHPEPEEALVISGGAGGLINEMLKHPLKRIDYAELDPTIIAMLKEYPAGITQRELGDKRVNIINTDGRLFVRTTKNRYDIILLGLSNPSDLATARFFTREFFRLLKQRLNAGGIVGFCLPGSLTYLSPQLRDLNACILNALRNNYAYVRIIPGDYNMFLASDSPDIMKTDAALIFRRISRRNIESSLLLPAYLDYRLDKRHLKWFMDSMHGATLKVNRDSAPFAVFQTLVIWNSQFSTKLAHFFEFLQNMELGCYAILILAITAIFFLVFYRRSSFPRLSLAYSIATTGFFGMLMNLVLIFSFQVYYGYLYYQIGIMVAIFMAGTALGSILASRALTGARNNLRRFIKIEFLIVFFSIALAVFITKAAGHFTRIAFVFASLFFIPGFLVGLEFPLAGKIYQDSKPEIAKTAGTLYFADLAGGWIAGMCAGVIFLPILGVFNTCLLAVLFKASSLILLLFAKGRFSK
ncbi:MAG: fused MFS/spermidine synthase [Candidatus Omnitrophica bacterium]|nr:fused MFS/spermidine synthase [Candidatus Omnitrophota bacterium]